MKTRHRILTMLVALAALLGVVTAPAATAIQGCPAGSTTILIGPAVPGGNSYAGCRMNGQHWIAQESSGEYYQNNYLVWGNQSGTLNQRIVVGSDWELYAADCFQEHCDPWESLGGKANSHGGGIFFYATGFGYGHPYPTTGYLRVYGTDGQYYCNHGDSGIFTGWRVDHGGTCA